jgi:hypothetical protein
VPNNDQKYIANQSLWGGQMFAHSGMVNSLHLKICPICMHSPHIQASHGEQISKFNFHAISEGQ